MAIGLAIEIRRTKTVRPCAGPAQTRGASITLAPLFSFWRRRREFFFDAEEWDRRFEDDAQSGRLDDLFRKAIEDFNAGKAREL